MIQPARIAGANAICESEAQGKFANADAFRALMEGADGAYRDAVLLNTAAALVVVGKADDLKMIKGVGPKLEKLCNTLGFWHFDQVAAWNSDEVAWVDANLQGFKGRVSRDGWVEQARALAAGDD